jgi:hypothetical protein
MKRSVFIVVLLRICLPVSKLVNRISWRFGRPYRCRLDDIEAISHNLAPGTVILTHRDFECSSLFIPGYWTHAAVVLDQGRIIDATRKGVCINSAVSFFATVDDFILLKPTFGGDERIANACRIAAGLAGRPFSFTFRNTHRVFYCAGLVCWIYLQTFNQAEPGNLPNPLGDFVEGKIIRPIEFIFNADHWKVFACSAPVKKNAYEIFSALSGRYSTTKKL